MGFFGKIIKGATNLLGKGSLAGGLLEAAMPWGKALGFLGGAYLTNQAIKDERALLNKKKQQGKIGQADAIQGGKFAVEDYNIKQGMAGESFDLATDRALDATEIRRDSAMDTFSRTNLRSGYQDQVVDAIDNSYGAAIDAAELKYQGTSFANAQNLRNQLSQYQDIFLIGVESTLLSPCIRWNSVRSKWVYPFLS